MAFTIIIQYSSKQMTFISFPNHTINAGWTTTNNIYFQSYTTRGNKCAKKIKDIYTRSYRIKNKSSFSSYQTSALPTLLSGNSATTHLRTSATANHSRPHATARPQKLVGIGDVRQYLLKTGIHMKKTDTTALPTRANSTGHCTQVMQQDSRHTASSRLRGSLDVLAVVSDSVPIKALNK